MKKTKQNHRAAGLKAWDTRRKNLLKNAKPKVGVKPTKQHPAPSTEESRPTLLNKSAPTQEGKPDWRAAGLKAWDTRRKNILKNDKPKVAKPTKHATPPTQKGETDWRAADNKPTKAGPIGTRELRMLIPSNAKVMIYAEGKKPISV